MQEQKTATFSIGDTVKYSQPRKGEENFRFHVRGDYGDKIEIQLICDWLIQPIETLAPEHITLA